MQNQPEEILVTRRFRVVRHSQTGPDGRVHVRESVQHPGAVVILPIFDDGRVCLIRNYRVAVDRTLIELPAGTLEPGEDPAKCAERELIEETGCRADSFQKLGEFYMSPGILNERMHLFLARGMRQGKPALEPGEQIETYIVSWEEAMRMADYGSIEDAKTLIGLLAFDRLRPK